MPIGFYSDKISKSKIVKIGGLFTFFTIILTILLLYWIGDDHY